MRLMATVNILLSSGLRDASQLRSDFLLHGSTPRFCERHGPHACGLLRRRDPLRIEPLLHGSGAHRLDPPYRRIEFGLFLRVPLFFGCSREQHQLPTTNNSSGTRRRTPGGRSPKTTWQCGPLRRAPTAPRSPTAAPWTISCTLLTAFSVFKKNSRKCSQS